MTMTQWFACYILHESIICDDKDPPWLNKKIKYLINLKNKIYKLYCSSKNNLQYSKLLDLQNELNNSIEDLKNRHYSRMSLKLVDPRSSPKMFSSKLKTILNNKKIPCIAPLYDKISLLLILKKKLKFSIQLKIIFKSCFKKGNFHEIGIMQTKHHKQSVSNYSPIFLLRISDKIFEGLLHIVYYYNMFVYILQQHCYIQYC